MLCWGGNYRAQIGTGLSSSMFGGESSPVPVVGLTDVVSLALGEQHTCAVLADGTARCWGRNDYGQVGAGFVSPFETPFVSTPTQVIGLSNVVSMSASAATTCAVLADGTARCWGWNAYGQLGDGSTTDRTSPVQVSGLTGVSQLDLGSTHACARLSNGSVRCWGSNSVGQLGDGSTTSSTTSVSVAGLQNITQVDVGTEGFHTCARRNDSTLFCWGSNFYGQLGDGSTTTRPSPVQVSGGFNAVSVSAGSAHTCAISTSGSLFCWGIANSGQLGIGAVPFGPNPDCPNSNNIRCYTSPQSVAAGTPTMVSAAPNSTCTLYADLSIKCWGHNGYGQVGDGTTEQRLVPTTLPTFAPQPGFPATVTVSAQTEYGLVEISVTLTSD